MNKKNILANGSRALILGLSFKENCPDIRNTRVHELVTELEGYGVNVDVSDPWVSPEEAISEYGLSLVNNPQANTYDVIVLAVAHNEFIKIGVDKIRSFGKKNHILYDIKSILPRANVDGRL